LARRRQGVAGDLKWVTGKVSSKEERVGAHRNSGSTVRRCKRRRVVAFVGGEGAPVGGDGGCGVLQHWRGKGVRKIARNCRDWQLGEELTGEWRTAAVLGQNP
jgi:hypothetical protein